VNNNCLFLNFLLLVNNIAGVYSEFAWIEAFHMQMASNKSGIESFDFHDARLCHGVQHHHEQSVFVCSLI
jgi:hypothetical protein